MTYGVPRCKFSWLYLFAIKSYRNLIISIVFYCFRHLLRHNPQNIDITVLIFSMQPHFTMIHHLWKFHFFSISRTYSKNRGGHFVHVWSYSKSPMWGRVKRHLASIVFSRPTSQSFFPHSLKLSKFLELNVRWTPLRTVELC